MIFQGRNDMKLQTMSVIASVLATFCLAGNAVAAGKDKIDLGKREYMNKCAVCHGQSGKGDGGVADVLKVAPTDLTTLSKKNGGVFPFERVLMSIDGRQVVKGHGDRDMPIWGSDYSREKAQAGEYYFDTPYDMEMYTRARILSIIDYLHRIQAK
jgi:mono/diheme cytochrome c family protein